ncbi:SRPBCC family protein [Lacipirellula limnantheis]|uniref:Polyketide cyclase / dehydrase and lipid transport n=1 Tax=Lacipirellula limnantheis TaxID=2528024 RepID=A0A517TWG0_9BACT|nr:SRPBCC family protein [Lacipirellula limnantheis]QDT72704.1 Polyketide cyclase / dehydrase and lipid transport [Lacipirellula limnantheis]
MTTPANAADPSLAPRWAVLWLLAAGLYNLLWGAIVIAFPNLLFDFAGIAHPNYPQIWQCVGMIVGVYGIGYLIAAADPRTHWPIVLVGLLGKIFGPLGFAAALWQGTLPPRFGVTILSNDLLWWIPFTLILLDAAQYHRRRSAAARAAPPTAAQLRFVKESRINAPPAAVFAFHESPAALTQLIPPWEAMRVAESPGSLAVGSRVVLRGKVGPLPVEWVAVHTEYDPPHLFADRQASGPFAYWLHRHHMLDDGAGGTLLRDEVAYALPLGLIGRYLGDAFVRRKLERMFEYRHETTRRLVESSSTGAAATTPQ